VARQKGPLAELPLGPSAYRNTALFSDHFLSTRLQEMPWFMRRRPASRDARTKILETVDRVRPEEALADASEGQCEEDIIRPILTLLGHSFLVRTSAQAAKSKNFPDFALFRDDQDRDNARAEVADGDYSRVLAIVEGKYWGRNLDRAEQSSRDYLTNANPSFQIVNYLILTGRRWGILTNGRLWRLYCRDSPQPLERYYEVDLPSLLHQAGADAFLYYFYGFFSRDALQPISGAETHVDRVRAGSADFAEEVGEELRSRAFPAVTRLAAGLIAGRRSGLTPEELSTVYDNALIVLCRLLFVLFAEARELLPLETNASYRDQLSLHSVVREVGEARELKRPFSDTSTRMWSRLRALWAAIDSGDTVLGVPEYDGELFAADAHPYLIEYTIPDRYLADAVDLVGRTADTTESHYVDYRSLSVAHLGTIYEGLLEHTLGLDRTRSDSTGHARATSMSASFSRRSEIDVGRLVPTIPRIRLFAISSRRRSIRWSLARMRLRFSGSAFVILRWGLVISSSPPWTFWRSRSRRRRTLASRPTKMT
jgi:hypothetical protein